MKKNVHLHIVVEAEALEKLKKEARERGVNLSEMCRLKLASPSKLEKVELLLESFLKNVKPNSNKSDN